MKKISLQLSLALSLLPLCSSVIAAQTQVQANAGLNPDIAWLLGAAILGFAVVARRSPRPPVHPEAHPQH